MNGTEHRGTREEVLVSCTRSGSGSAAAWDVRRVVCVESGTGRQQQQAGCR